MTESTITINGQTLTTGQSLTLRVALSSFMTHLSANEDVLGNNQHGRDMRSTYLTLGRVVEKMLCKGEAKKEPPKK